MSTPAFLRLQRIRQLSHTYIVYPSAVHTRLEHSIGTMHVAGRMCDALGITDNNKRLVRISALLHDIGHGPFSHLFEHVMKKINPDCANIHETISTMIITTNKDIGSILSNEDKRTIDRLIHDGAKNGRQPTLATASQKHDHDIDDDLPLMSSIVSGNLDADKLDYLKRDSYHIGAKYGEFDLERIINVLQRSATSPSLVSVSRKGVSALENYRLARYLVHAQVYEHHTRLAADLMFLRSLNKAIHHEGVFDKKRLKLTNPDFLSFYHGLDDSSIYYTIINSDQSSTSRKILLDILNRRLLKRASYFTSKDIAGAFFYQNLLKDDSSLQQISDEILKSLDPQLESHHVILHRSKITIKLYEDPDLFYTHKGKDHPISDLSPISSDREVNWFYAFGPPDRPTREKINAMLASKLNVPPDTISADIR
ncbi:MAG: HD domain-containing protein [Thaumarchaeota archaeon]|nr:HD domain-containing protein [Nitrososphaerota archaeon]